MLINLSEIMSKNDRVEHMKVPVELQNFTLDGLIYEFCTKNPFAMIITNLGKKRVLIEGSTNLSLSIPCSRCLEPVTVDFDIQLSKEIDFSVSEEERVKDLDEINYLNGYNLDVDMLIYDEILLDFPMKVLCDDSCKGICNVCGTNLNKGDCNCESTGLDPRMSVIRDIFNKYKEV